LPGKFAGVSGSYEPCQAFGPPFGGRQLGIAVSVDMRQARICDKDEEAKTAVIQLPQPMVLHSRVDHERTKTWEVVRKSWLTWVAIQTAFETR